MIETHVSDAICVISAHGEWDMQTAPAVIAALDEATSAGSAFVFVDLAGVSFMDVAGSRPLRAAVQRCRARGSQLFVIHPSPMIAKLLRLLGAGDAIAPLESSDDAPRRGAAQLA